MAFKFRSPIGKSRLSPLAEITPYGPDFSAKNDQPVPLTNPALPQVGGGMAIDLFRDKQEENERLKKELDELKKANANPPKKADAPGEVMADRDKPLWSKRKAAEAGMVARGINPATRINAQPGNVAADAPPPKELKNFYRIGEDRDKYGFTKESDWEDQFKPQILIPGKGDGLQFKQKPAEMVLDKIMPGFAKATPKQRAAMWLTEVGQAPRANDGWVRPSDTAQDLNAGFQGYGIGAQIKGAPTGARTAANSYGFGFAAPKLPQPVVSNPPTIIPQVEPFPDEMPGINVKTI